MNAATLQQLIDEGIFGPGAFLRETHISLLVIGPAHVWKLKKPVQYSFLDFSTLAQRKLYCARELDLNRRLAPQVYLDVVELRSEGRHWGLGPGPGVVAEYALRMLRLDNSLEMDILLHEGKVTEGMMAGLGRVVARFHQGADVVRALQHGNAMTYFVDFDDIGCIAGLVEAELGTAARAALDKGRGEARAYLEGHAAFIDQRRAAGMVRDVHGDLHAGNIFLYPDPVVFDCVEFNDHFRQIDVLNEIAFLCMDLDVRGHAALKASFLDAYRAVFPCLDSGAEQMLFRYFKAYRANIRAKVAGLRAKQAEGAQREEAIAEMSRYLGWMHRYLDALHGVL